MSAQIIPIPLTCDGECPSTGSAAVPGPQGAAGTNGTDGDDGVSPITYAANYSPAAQPTMPAEGASVVVNLLSGYPNTAFQVNSFVTVAFWGTLKIVAIPSSTSLTLQNPENTAASTYASNAAPGTSLPANSKITVAGEQGPAGATPANALLAANNLSDVANAATSRTNLGLGTAATLTAGVANTNVPQVDDAAGLTNGEMLRATATGIESVTAATGRTALGLGTMATQNAGAVAITGGTLNGTLGGTTPAAAAVTTLAASSTVAISGTATLSGALFTPSTAIQTLAAGNAVSPNAAKVRVVSNGGAVTITATPSITNPAADGQRLLILGTSDVDTVTLQDISSLGGSNLNLAGGANVTLGAGDILELIWDATMGGWFEIGRSNN